MALRTSADEEAKTSPVSLSVPIVCSRASVVLEPQASVTNTGHRLRSKACLTVGPIPTSSAMPAMTKQSSCASLIAKLRKVPSNADIVTLSMMTYPSRGASSGTISQSAQIGEGRPISEKLKALPPASVRVTQMRLTA